jgi:hypothetical protein
MVAPESVSDDEDFEEDDLDEGAYLESIVERGERIDVAAVYPGFTTRDFVEFAKTAWGFVPRWAQLQLEREEAKHRE